MAMALPVYAEVNPLPDVPGEVELLEDEPGTASGEDTIEQLPDANAPPKQEADAEQDAATPVPEQSAGPEQPAPTETPEPTAEPALTPEPTATATATPVPTVTPTATPEPTEQPQKMYAARSVNNVQAVSEGGVPATYTLYFAVPDGWSDYKKVKIYAIVGNNADEGGDKKYYLEMQEVSETEDGRKIYSAVLKYKEHYPNGGLAGLEFRGYKDDTPTDNKPESTVVIVQVENNNNNRRWMTFNPTDTSYIGGDYYDGKTSKWGTFTVGHKYFAKKAMTFENKTSETLTNVKAWFYEPNDESGKLEPVGDPISLNSIASGSTATFKIPDGFCSFVRFTAGDNNTEISEYYNFYNEKVTGENQKSFQYSEGRCYCYMYNDIGDATWGRPGATRIYYDATFSKMALNGDTNDYSIPKANNNPAATIYYRIKAEGKDSESGKLVKDGTNENLYYIDIPQGYSSIIFSGEEINDDNTTRGNGVSTAWLTIPTDDKNCFYADTNDAAVYDNNATRDGYWAPKGTLRDAETWKNPETKVVDIKSAEFTEKPNTKYVTSTLYDYYTDYELNGKNRNSYDNDNTPNQRHWVPFRQFDQAISDYYQSYVDKNTEKPIIYPIYTGHFQPNDWYMPFSAVAATLNLYGWAKNYQIFIAANNSNFDTGNVTGKNSYAFQGIVADKRDSDGDIVMNGTTLKEPHFNEDFLTGQNSKHAKLGKVYHNVEFPFTQEEVFVESDKKGEGIKYWWFDSSITSLYLRKDTKSDQLYLGNDSTGETNAKYKAEYKSDKSHNVDSANNSDPGKVSTEYGFFPFNENTTSKSAVNYNYGYGAKLEIPFTLTSTGTVEDKHGNEIPIRFYFSGDDDVWVFIDNQLVLDIGGAHAKVSGMLEFDQQGDKKDTVTSYVSQVKNSKTGNYGAEECDKNNHKTEKNITYLGTTETYYKNASVPISGLSTGKHTLTMYYMERGMWESNMAVAFNFPDNNELQVQKVVDLKNVTDDDFKNCFQNQKIFNFTIQNQATHYGTKVAAKPNPSDTEKVNLTAGGNTIESATPGKKDDYIFELVKNPWPDSGNENEKVLHWYARYMDTQSAAREKRRGILTLENPINIENMRFLTFQVYVSQKDGSDLSLNNLYLELLDNQDLLEPPKSPGQKGSLGTTGINGATYGSVEVTTDQWVTVKLDLHKMKEQGDFNNNVRTIRVGDNYNRNIYFRNFTFIPKAVPSTMTGFTTDQEKIPDYGSAESGHLENAENAQYTSNMDTDTQLVDKDGRFVLEDGETVTFSDQFRRGSYISLKEDLNKNLYDTTWTVCENGKEVESMSGGDSVSLPDSTPSLKEQEGSSPNDGRTEKIRTNDDQTNNNYKGTKPEGNTIVFRSYKDPDEKNSTLTKLKVKYVNTVKTGGLTIQKKAAEGEKGAINGIYKFKVTFNDVGGEGLEEKDIIKNVEINMNDEDKYPDHTVTITGIPVGTRYTIEEVTPLDGSRLQSVTVPKGCDSADVIDNTVEGVIKKPNTCPITAIFTNTRRTLINIEFNKLWKDANGKDDLSTAKQPKEIYIQLQRRLETSIDDKDWELVKYPAGSPKDYFTITPDDNNGWKHTFSGLDQRPVGNTDTNYQYRIVEGTVDEAGKFAPAAKDGTITIDGNTYGVTVKAEATPNSEKGSAGSSTGNTATANSENGATTTPAKVNGGTITGGSGKIELTNKLQNPKFVLDIIKKDAEKGENDKEVFLKDVEFKLEKLVDTTNEGEPQKVDTAYKFDNTTNTGSITAITDGSGRITGVFTNLKPGTYRLTETKAHPGYNLLAQPIKIQFTQDGKCYIDGQRITDEGKFKPGANNTYTMNLTVLNRKTPELPHTGADAPSLWLLIGMPLAVAGLLIFTFRYNRKGGRRH